jgi:hypothetical protein
MTKGNQKPFEDGRKEEKTYSAVNEEERQRDIIETIGLICLTIHFNLYIYFF